ncbi:YdaU family protein [Acinetobacter sp. YH12073]|uniref:YdaU family protein n=1 Tax=Acinetobacter sp. YH12073 TaxID=2601069 RepID=UPI0015D2FED7|nr:YdaU family protein [Acinetobacter sp. YH12073]
MHYYKKNIGDYRSATAHLSLLEHGVYNWLLDTYYLNEKPLPLNERELFRMALARTEDEKNAVRDILIEFFVETENGWVHNRCESEVKAYHAKAETNRKNGGNGGRPKKQAKENPNGFQMNDKETQSVNFGIPQETLTKNQEPLTINQENTHTNAQADFSGSDHWKPDLEQLAIALRTTKYSQRVSEILSMEDFQFHLGNFNTHHENNHQLTDNQKLRKFAQWIFQEFEKQLAKTEREAKKSTGRIPEKQNSRNVNDAWGEVQQYAPASDNIELEDLV